jgi:hypothetical protein
MESTTNSDICSLCNISLADKQYYKLNCQHEFHTECIINWFRDKSYYCPCCSNVTDINTNSQIDTFTGYLNYIDYQLEIAKTKHIVPSFRFASNEARKKSAPPELKRLYARYKRMLANNQKLKVELDNYKATELKEYNVMKKKHRKIYISNRRRVTRIRGMKRQICSFLR